MTVTVLLFASYADALGMDALRLEIGEGERVADVVSRVQAMAGAERLPPVPLVAVNARYASTAQTLSAGDELALIPPVSGG